MLPIPKNEIKNGFQEHEKNGIKKHKNIIIIKFPNDAQLNVYLNSNFCLFF